MPTCTPKNSACSISGSGPSGNCSGSESSACDPICESATCIETYSGPYSHRHQVTFCRCGRYVLPPNLLNALNVDSTFGGIYTSIAGGLGATGGQYCPDSQDPFSFGSTAMDQITTDIEVLVNVRAESGVVIDVHELSSFADGLYKVQVKGLAAPPYAYPNTTPVKTPHADFPHSLGNTKARPAKPRVTVINKSVFPAYITAGPEDCDNRKFEGVSNQIGTRAGERMCLEYDPVVKTWLVLDHY
jgi:hypothetical protein